MALSNPRWSVGYRFTDTNGDTKSRSLSGINYTTDESDPSALVTGYTSTEVDAFARILVQVVNGVFQRTTLTGQYEIS